MIIYIHGFGGSGQGNKAKVLKGLLSVYDGVIAPSLPSNPALAIQTLCEIIECFKKVDNVHLVGSSLGGYYALHLADKYKLPCVLINPATKPYETLSRALGFAPNFYDGSTYEWKQEHLDLLRELEPNNYDHSKLLVFLQKGDELLDYRDALAKLDGSKFVVEGGGSHSFDGIEQHIGTIMEFFTFYSTRLVSVFAKITDVDVQMFLRTIDKKDLVYALPSLPESVQDKIFANLSRKAEQTIMEEIEFSKRDISQQNLREAIERLDNEACRLFHSLYDGIAASVKPFATPKNTLSSHGFDALTHIDGLCVEPVKRALEFAAKAHGEQKTPFGYPYLYHVVTVALEAYYGLMNDKAPLEECTNAFIVALLHDTIEDTDTSYDEIAKLVADDVVAKGVLALTKDKTLPTKEDQMRDSARRIKELPKWVWCVKLADRITNLTGVPSHWDEAKKERYLNEARTIWAELKEASATLGEKLLGKIKTYS